MRPRLIFRCSYHWLDICTPAVDRPIFTQLVVQILILYLSAVFRNKSKKTQKGNQLPFQLLAVLPCTISSQKPSAFPVCRVCLVPQLDNLLQQGSVDLLRLLRLATTLPCAAVLSQTQCLTAFVQSVESSFDYSTMHMHMLATKQTFTSHARCTSYSESDCHFLSYQFVTKLGPHLPNELSLFSCSCCVFGLQEAELGSSGSSRFFSLSTDTRKSAALTREACENFCQNSHFCVLQPSLLVELT